MSYKANNSNWWRGGVIYQIYPRSYQDSNGDGIGDLPGITERLTHVAELGADGIWLSPFFKSPMKDFGYDVSDYCDVDPMFGTIADFKALLDRAHLLGLKVMIDQVLSHASDQHPWFVESRSSRDNAKADWFVWADAREDGTPPNNWLSIFGGSAWQWDTRRCQYYLHNFLSSQPDLNFHNPEVQQALLQTVKFWLDMGVDGYRLDTANFYFHDALLRDNPGKGMPSRDNPDPAVNPFNPYAWQAHVYDKSRPENLLFLEALRALLDQYPDTTMVGEIGDDDGLARVAEYTSTGAQGQRRLHMAYCFDFLGEARSAPFLHGVLSRFNHVVGDGWPCWALSNHDCVRSATRWGGAQPDPRLMRLAAAFQMGLRGTVCLYQGEELGLPEAQVAFEDLQDPYGITMWPEYKGRDGCRTPMPWQANAQHAGFSTAEKTWLPLDSRHSALAVDQQGGPDSLLSYFKQIIAWRKKQAALVHGEMQLWASDEQTLSFVRAHDGQSILCVYNFSDQVAEMALPADWAGAQILHDSGTQGVRVDAQRVHFEPWACAFLRRPNGH
ncbi:MAG: Oligo,6-glucosidase 1 [Pseudomonadota bacterium]